MENFKMMFDAKNKISARMKRWLLYSFTVPIAAVAVVCCKIEARGYVVSILLLVSMWLLFVKRLVANIKDMDKMSHINAELTLAKNLQKSMLSPLETDTPQLKVDALIVPAKNVSGDLYYYFVRNGYLYFCIGDVSGKGLPASLFMSKTVSLFICISRYAIRADDIAEQLNIELCQNNASSMFVTMFIGILNIETGELQYCNAGHDEPLLWNGDDSSKPCYLSTSDNVPLGVDEEEPYTQGEMILNPGSRLCLYTDGVTEAKRKDREMYGEDRLLDCFSRHLPVQDHACDAIRTDVKTFVDGNEQSDDITILCIDVKRPQGDKEETA